ncbi:MAG: phosphonopyruvate decarboxylase [Parcubacteria group bacterium]|nr:phosphonopyruvate decarboxylase [Parcubacteria group bacterium]
MISLRRFMLTARELLEVLQKNDIRFFTGVPDSGLKDFLVYLNDQKNVAHVRAANEGQAIGIATGYHLATGKMPLVYLQNAGLGNTVNPLTSLADKTVYGIPMLLFVSWRGEPGTTDEPQHARMGEITPKLFELMDIPYEVANGDIAEFETQIRDLKTKSMAEQQPVALIFQRGLFAEEKSAEEFSGLKRQDTLEIILEKIGNAPVVSTTGKTSRELFELRDARQEGHEKDFLVIGSMGAASLIGLGIARSVQETVYVFDGDGSLLMHLGALPTIGHYAPKNFCHILLDNRVHESTGNQPTVSETMDWEALFRASGYEDVKRVSTKEELAALDVKHLKSPSAVIISLVPGSQKNLSRPSAKSPVERKKEFMSFIEKFRA